MRKLIVPLAFSFLCGGSLAHGIDLPADASPTFFSSPTAYSSQYFDRVLGGLQLQLGSNTADLPFTYAKIADGKANFNSRPYAYTPEQYHGIFTSYGLELSPENVKNVLTVSSYARVAGDKITFGNKPIAYGGSEWKNILAAYSLPMQKVVKSPPPAPSKPGDDDGDGVLNNKDACPGTPKYAAVDERGCWALSSALLFDFDKAVIKKEFYSLLDNTKKVFDSHPQMRVEVQGHADSKGAVDYNQNLSEKRARAVVNYLVEKVGIAADRLTARGYGELKPAYTNDTEEGQAKNRRVQFSPIR